MKIESVPLDKLSLLERNPRRHPERQIEELVRSYTEFGQYRPLVVDEEGTILAGNGMFQALKRAGAAAASVYRVTGLSEDDKTRLVLADNRTGDLSNDDFDVVEELLRELTDFSVPGYDDETIRQLVASAEEIIEDAGGYGTLDGDTITRLQEREDDTDELNEGATVGTPPKPPSGVLLPDDGDDPTGWEDGHPCPTCGRPW